VTKKAKPCSVSISLELEIISKKFCEDYHLKSFSELVRKSLLNYLSAKDSEWTEGFKLYGRLNEIKDTIEIIRNNRDSMIYDGSGLEEIIVLRVEGTNEYACKPAFGFNKFKRGQIKNEEERQIYERYSKIIIAYNEERKKILQNPVYINWLNYTLKRIREYPNKQPTQDT
jgi:hypothetical protein